MAPRPDVGARIRRLLACVVAAVGAVKLADLAAGRDSGIDRLLFAAELATAVTANNNAMAPNTARVRLNKRSPP